MEKIARFLPLGLFCVFSVKLMMQDYQDFSDAATLLVMGGLSAFFIHKKSEEFQHLESKLKQLESAAEKDAQEVARLKKEVEDTKGLIGGIKLGQQLKTQMNRN